MELLLAGIYIAFCWIIFKIFRIPVNQWSLATATLGGLIGIVLLLLVMNYNHPFTTQARLYFTVTPILPGVRGRVIEVPVTPNVPLKEGDVLFKIDPRPFQYAVDQKEAQLAEAEQNVKQLKSALDQATAEKERMNAQSRLAQENFDRQQQLFDAKVISKATLDTFARNLETARQSVAAATAQEESARLAYTSEIGGTNTTVAGLQAELDQAEVRARPDRDSRPRTWLRDAGCTSSGRFHCSNPAHAGDGVREYGSSGHRSCGGVSTELVAKGVARRCGRNSLRRRARTDLPW